MLRSSSLPLGNGAYFDSVRTNIFHFSLLSLTFSLGPLSKEERKALAVLCRLLSRGCRRFPSPEESDIALGMLYDAVTGFDMRETGEEVLFRASIDFANEDSFNRPLLNDALGYLIESLKDPILLSPSFSEQLCLTLDSYKGDLMREACEPESVAARRYSDLCARAFSRDGFLSWEDLLSIPKSVTEKDVLFIYEKVKSAPLVHVCSVGQADGQSVLSELDVHFPKRAAIKPSSPSCPVTPVSSFEQISGAMARVHLGYRADGDADTCSLLATLLGGFASSRLFTVLREEEQLCYSVSASYDRRLKLLTVSSALSPDGLERALEIIERELEGARVISDSLFSEAKEALLIGACELSESRHLLDSYLLSARIRLADTDTEGIVERIERIGKEDVEAAASSLSPAVRYIGLPSGKRVGGAI